MVCAEITKPSVWPSGCDRATSALPTIVPAPGLFSTTTGTDHFADIASPISLATTSVGPPAANGTTNLTLPDGNLLSAQAREMQGAANVAARPATTCLRRIMTILPVFCRLCPPGIVGPAAVTI